MFKSKPWKFQELFRCQCYICKDVLESRIPSVLTNDLSLKIFKFVFKCGFATEVFIILLCLSVILEEKCNCLYVYMYIPL